MSESRPHPADRASRQTPLADVQVQDARRAILTTALFLLVLGTFLLMVREMLVAGLLGGLIGAYLRPVYRWIADRTGWSVPAALITLVLLIVPAALVMVYGYLELRDAAEYLAAHTGNVAAEIETALRRIPFLGRVDASESLEAGLGWAARLATRMPAGLQGILSEFAVDASVFLFTAFYVLTCAERIAAYLRGRVADRYAAFAERLETHVQGVLYGAVYGTLITQILKALLVLGLNLLFGVPLPIVLALVAFVIGFFPVVGSWTVYLPVAGYLLVFQHAPWEALAMLVLGLGGSTVLLSLVVRPKLAAAQSGVLDFYWMFIGLVAGVYTFGVPGIILGPIIVGLLKAVVDTITIEPDVAGATHPHAEDPETDDGEPAARVFAEEKIRAQRAPQG